MASVKLRMALHTMLEANAFLCNQVSQAVCGSIALRERKCNQLTQKG